MHFLLTFDIEDWFQVENFKAYIPFSSWSSYELRVEKNVHRLLDLLDSVSVESQVASRESQVEPLSRSNALTPSRPHAGFDSPALSAMSYELSAIKPKATFFILGWIAERLPHLVQEIGSRGHEIASHGYRHQLCNGLPGDDLKEDLAKSKKLLEDLVGISVTGYRAPSFSINHDTLDMLQECGYHYDSSFNSFGGNSRHGRLNLRPKGDKSIAYPITSNFFELPISNLDFGGHILPLGGGGYFRLMPFVLFTQGVKAILKKQNAYLFYLHPWEIDPEQPRVNEASIQLRFRHYHNLAKTETRLSNLIRTFKDCRFVTCSQYLKEMT